VHLVLGIEWARCRKWSGVVFPKQNKVEEDKRDYFSGIIFQHCGFLLDIGSGGVVVGLSTRVWTSELHYAYAIECKWHRNLDGFVLLPSKPFLSKSILSQCLSCE